MPHKTPPLAGRHECAVYTEHSGELPQAEFTSAEDAKSKRVVPPKATETKPLASPEVLFFVIILLVLS